MICNYHYYKMTKRLPLEIILLKCFPRTLNSGQLTKNNSYYRDCKRSHFVQHEQLLTKLQKNFGILGPLHNWLKSYLSNRLQYTVVNGVKSKMQSVSVGIPQGSVLGPTLFALYTSDLPSSVSFGNTHHQE